MYAGGLRARITCIDLRVLGREFAGREFDLQFLQDLPPAVDPCGENGEFHSFVYDAPFFRRPLTVTAGELHQDGNFLFADLLP
jgi:diphthamide synthase (EF-2-diphthine--ammonia ligase)